MAKLSKKELRRRRHNRLRKKIEGTAERPRMALFTSNKHIYVQLIDDEAGHTLASASTLDATAKETGAAGNVEGGKKIGKIIADKAKSAGIERVVFDRGGFSFQGMIQAVADSSRENGLKF